MKQSILTVLCVLAALSVAAGVAQAQPVAPSTFDPVVVTATRTERSALDVPASVDLIDRETLRDGQLRVNLSETLARVPGIVVLDRENYAQDLQISIRGFGSRSSFGVRGVRLYVDGVPASFPDGQGQVSHFPLNAAERIEVLRGPFSALYGNSSGGVLSLTTQLRPQPQRFEMSGAAGSYGTWRAGLNAVGGADPYAFAIDVGRFNTDGARPHSAAQRDTANLRAAFLDSPLGRVRLSLNSVSMPNAQDALGLKRADFDAHPDGTDQTAIDFNTRKNTRQTTAGIDVQSRAGEGGTLNTAVWLGTRSVTQFQAIPAATQTNPRQPGGVIDFDRIFGGIDFRFTRELAALTATVGVTAERLDEDRRGYENFAGSALGVLGRLRRDEFNRIDSTDAYAQIEARLSDAWRLHAGVRAARVSFESSDRYIVGVNGDDSGSKVFSATNPTAGVVFKPSAAVSFYASYGRGFETPTLNELAYRPDGSAGFNEALRAAKSDNVEMGVKAQWSSALRTTLALFSIRTDDDLVVRTNSGGRSAFGNVARTRRDGLEAALDWRVSPALSVYASAAAIRARFATAFLTCGAPPCTVPTLPVAEGNRLPGIPARTAFAEMKYRSDWADLGVEARAQSPLYVDDRNTDRAAGYATLSVVAARTFNLFDRAMRGFFRIDNLFDRRYAGSVIVNEANGRFFEPAPGRHWLLGLDVPL